MVGQSENNFCRKHPQCWYFFYANVSAAEKLVPLHEDLSASGFRKKLFSDKLLSTAYYYISYARPIGIALAKVLIINAVY